FENSNQIRFTNLNFCSKIIYVCSISKSLHPWRSWRLILYSFSTLCVLCASPCLCGKSLRIFTFAASPPHIRRNATPQNAAADPRELSAALADRSAASTMQKCQFGGFERASRLPFRRELCKICNFCEFCAISAIAHNGGYENETSPKPN